MSNEYFDKSTAKIFFSQQRSVNLISVIYDFLDIYEILKLSNLNKKVFTLVKNKTNPERLKLLADPSNYENFIYSSPKSNNNNLKYLKDYLSYTIIKNNIKEFVFKLEPKDDDYIQSISCKNLYNEDLDKIKSLSSKANFTYFNKFSMKEKKIKKLIFEGKCTDYFNVKIENFFDYLNVNNHLRNFQFLNCGVINDHFFNIIPNIISGSAKLNNLTFIFESCTISNTSMEKFINKLNKKTFLICIKKFKLVNCDISLKSLKFIQRILNYGEDSLLSELEMSRTKLYVIPDTKQIYNGIYSNAETKNKSQKINDHKLALNFFNNLEHVINIKILKFDECGLDDSFLSSISNILNKCKFLQLFSLKRNNFSLNKEMIHMMIERVEKRREEIEEDTKIKTEIKNTHNNQTSCLKTTTCIKNNFKIKISNKNSPIYIFTLDQNILKFKQVKTTKFITDFFNDHIVPFPYNSLVYKTSHVNHYNDTFILANKSLSAGNVRHLTIKINSPLINNFYNAIKKSQTLESLHIIFPGLLSQKEIENFLNCLRENKTIKKLHIEDIRLSEINNNSYSSNISVGNFASNSRNKNYDLELNTFVLGILTKILNIVNSKGYRELKFQNSHLIKNDQYKLILENLMFCNTLEKLSILNCSANINVVKNIFAFLLTTANSRFKELELGINFEYFFEIELKNEFQYDTIKRKQELENLIREKVKYNSDLV